jgi:hypothetical protein
MPKPAAIVYVALQIRKFPTDPHIAIPIGIMGCYDAIAFFAAMLHVRSTRCIRFGRPARHASAPGSEGTRFVTLFAFPLAKRDYDCFNKDQRALMNSARLGRIFVSIPSLLGPAQARRVCLV